MTGLLLMACGVVLRAISADDPGFRRSAVLSLEKPTVVILDAGEHVIFWKRPGNTPAPRGGHDFEPAVIRAQDGTEVIAEAPRRVGDRHEGGFYYLELFRFATEQAGTYEVTLVPKPTTVSPEVFEMGDPVLPTGRASPDDQRRLIALIGGVIGLIMAVVGGAGLWRIG